MPFSLIHSPQDIFLHFQQVFDFPALTLHFFQVKAAGLHFFSGHPKIHSQPQKYLLLLQIHLLHHSIFEARHFQDSAWKQKANPAEVFQLSDSEVCQDFHLCCKGPDGIFQ